MILQIRLQDELHSFSPLFFETWKQYIYKYGSELFDLQTHHAGDEKEWSAGKPLDIIKHVTVRDNVFCRSSSTSQASHLLEL
jgi:hypothetical protein